MHVSRGRSTCHEGVARVPGRLVTMVKVFYTLTSFSLLFSYLLARHHHYLLCHIATLRRKMKMYIVTVTKAGMCEFVEYQPVNECTSDILPPHWLRNDNVDREISGSLVDRELWPAEREGKKNKRIITYDTCRW